MSVTVRTATESLVGTQVLRGTLVEIKTDGTLLVRPDGDPAGIVACDALVSSGPLHPGATVVYAMPPSSQHRGCVLGAVGPYRPPSGQSNEDNPHLVADKTTIELTADTKLVLKCGEGSISIGQDGTIIIKGARILSRSKGVNKIKGASVQIN